MVIPKYLLLILTTIFLINLVYAGSSLGNPLQVESEVSLAQICDNCTYVNVTTLKYPNSTEVVLDVEMTKNGQNYNYLLDRVYTRDKGIYTYTTCGDLDGVVTCEPIDFKINQSGTELTLEKSILYIALFVFFIVLFIFCLWMGLSLPSGNKKDEMTGYILAVSNLKYVKIFILCFAYLLMDAIVYFGYLISVGFLDMDTLGKFLYVLFYILTILIIPLFIIGAWITILNAVRDSQVGDMISRGLSVK